MHHRRHLLGEIEQQRGNVYAELRREVFGGEYGGVETFGDDEGGDGVSGLGFREGTRGRAFEKGKRRENG